MVSIDHLSIEMFVGWIHLHLIFIVYLLMQHKNYLNVMKGFIQIGSERGSETHQKTYNKFFCFN